MLLLLRSSSAAFLLALMHLLQVADTVGPASCQSVLPYMWSIGDAWLQVTKPKAAASL